MAARSRQSVQELVAQKALSLKNSGLIDGILLDWWNEERATSDNATEDGWKPILNYLEEQHARIEILRKVRDKVGDDFLILVNSNDRTVPLSAPYINGLFDLDGEIYMK